MIQCIGPISVGFLYIASAMLAKTRKRRNQNLCTASHILILSICILALHERGGHIRPLICTVSVQMAATFIISIFIDGLKQFGFIGIRHLPSSSLPFLSPHLNPIQSITKETSSSSPLTVYLLNTIMRIIMFDSEKLHESNFFAA
jgi:hypothetical protein